MLLGTLGASLLGNILTGFVRAGSGCPLYENKNGEGIVTAGSGKKKEK